MKHKHTIWNEKYRPDILDNYITSGEIKNIFQAYIDKQDIPHLLFAGRAGSGKTTLAKLIAKGIDCDLLYINATDERSMDVIREKIGGFASSASFKPLKIVILDEATHLLMASQVLLLNMIETYSAKTRFILTGNYPERLIDPLRSRLTEYALVPPSKTIIAQHIVRILENEGIEYELEGVAEIVKKCYPDLRRTINTLQKCSTTGKLVVNINLKSNQNYIELILEELSQPKPKFNTIRQILANSDVSDYTELFKSLYDNSSKYLKDKEGSVAVLVNEASYKANFSLDKEINTAALISQIIELK
jgi:DNA polymerase III delta prime subunit